METEAENTFIIRLIGSHSSYTVEDIERKMGIIAVKLGLEGIQLDVGLHREPGMGTAASLAAVWGYIESYLDSNAKPISVLDVATTLGMSEGTAKKHLQRLAQSDLAVIRTVRRTRKATHYYPSSHPKIMLAEYLEKYPVHIGRWVPKLQTW